MENKISLILYIFVQFNILDDELKYPRCELLRGTKQQDLDVLQFNRMTKTNSSVGSDHQNHSF